jgi:ribosome-binding ATPase YchF (GTP1/OBG family)
MDMPVAMQNFERIKNQEKDRILIPCSGESELALREAAKHGLIEYIPGENDFKIKEDSKITEAQKKALNFIKENVLKKFGNTGVQQVLDKSVFELLKYIPIFPGGINKLADQHGNVLPDCFLLPKDSTALDFAYKIHTDLGNHFIRAIDVKTRRTVGKEHLLKPGDVVEIVSDK